jgi:4-aminobutyrate aminotransferase and related aminotransferases
VIGGTFGGNALACAAALKVIEVMERDHLCERSVEIGDKIRTAFNNWKGKYAVVGDIRGLGGMVGIEFVKDRKTKEPNASLVSALIKECAAHGLLIENAGTYGNVVRFLAPLVITDAQLDAGLTILEDAIQKCM